MQSYIYLQLYITTYKGDIITTISVSQENYDRLTGRKAHPRQSFDEVIGNILDEVEKQEKKEDE